MAKPKGEIIDEKHPLYAKTGIGYLLGRQLEETEAEAAIFADSVFVRDLLLQKSDMMTGVIKKPVRIVLDETATPEGVPHSGAKAGKARPKGSATGIQPRGEYIATPYFVSKSNETAYRVSQWFLSKKTKGIMFIQGETGTGKSHLLHLMAKEAIDLGGRVYLNSAQGFIDALKDHFASKTTGIGNIYAENHFFMLDDFQVFNRDFTRGYVDTLFDVLNTLMMKDRNIVFSSDIDISSLVLLPDRIISRLRTSFAPDIMLPDVELKEQFLDYYAKKIEVEERLNDDARQVVLQSSRTLRDVAGALHMCLMLNKDGELPVRDLFNKLKAAGGKKGDAIDQVYEILAEYYGVTDAEKKKAKKGYRPRSLGRINSVLYYLFHDKTDVRTLRQRLEIEARKHGYTIEYGRKNFEAIKDRDRRDEIETILQDREDRTASLFGEG